MNHLLRLAGLLLASAGLALFAAACGGGGGDSLDSYFKDYEKIDNKAENDTADLQREYDAALSAASLNDQTRSDLQEYYNRQIAVRQTFVDDITSLNPPEQAKAAHDAYLAAYRKVLDAFRGIVDDVGQAQTVDDLDKIFNGADLTAAIDAANKTCADLQAIADNDNINVNLECD